MTWTFFKASGAKRMSSVETTPPGMVQAWPGPTTTVPAGWLVCDGSSVSRTTYSSLFAALGSASSVWGTPDANNFYLPDFRGMVLVGVSGSYTHASTTYGAATHTHTVNSHTHSYAHTHNMPDHYHTTVAHTHTIDPPSTTTGGADFQGSLILADGGSHRTFHDHTVNIPAFTSASSAPNTNTVTASIGASYLTSISQSSSTTSAETPGTTASNNLPLSKAVHYIIKT